MLFAPPTGGSGTRWTTRGWGSSTLEPASVSSSGEHSAQNFESNLPQVHKIWSGTLSVGTTGLWRRGGRGEEPESQGALHVRGLHHGHCWRRVRNWEIKRQDHRWNLVSAAAPEFSWTPTSDLAERSVATLSRTLLLPLRVTSQSVWLRLLASLTSAGDHDRDWHHDHLSAGDLDRDCLCQLIKFLTSQRRHISKMIF